MLSGCGATTADSPMQPRHALAIGFGRYLRERVLRNLFNRDPDVVEIKAVTCLLGGKDEYDELVVPLFVSLGLAIPDYIPELGDALTVLHSNRSYIAAIINTPTGLHTDQAFNCLEAGFDVYVERPIASHRDDLKELVATARESDAVLFTGSQRRLERPFQYIYDVVLNRKDFSELASIRCTLSSGERPTGWRVDSALAGGGVLLDSGYHQLDYAMWIAQAAGHEFDTGAVSYAYLSDEPWMVTNSNGLEATAVGHAHSNQGMDLFFDLSYATSRNAVFERIEVVDVDGARISMVRDQPVRSSEPGRITHQREDGSFVSAIIDGRNIELQSAQIASGANTSGPLRSFLRARQGDRDAWQSHPCSGASAVASWNLIREIYGNGIWRSHGKHATHA